MKHSGWISGLVAFFTSDSARTTAGNNTVLTSSGRITGHTARNRIKVVENLGMSYASSIGVQFLNDLRGIGICMSKYTY